MSEPERHTYAELVEALRDLGVLERGLADAAGWDQGTFEALLEEVGADTTGLKLEEATRYFLLYGGIAEDVRELRHATGQDDGVGRLDKKNMESVLGAEAARVSRSGFACLKRKSDFGRTMSDSQMAGLVLFCLPLQKLQEVSHDKPPWIILRVAFDYFMNRELETSENARKWFSADAG